MAVALDAPLRRLLAVVRSRGPLVALTGAGISAESGIPTFRGQDGYWTIGSVNYRAEQLATFATFCRQPAEVWGWYLYRRGVCLRAEPNAGHRALVGLEAAFGERFRLVTQNVDGLHQRAGSDAARVFEVHGNLHRARCAGGCSSPIGLPDRLGAAWPRGSLPDVETMAGLRCAHCAGWLRPHVLWFDECYDEEHFRFESSLAAVADAALLLVVGTAGATNLPNQMVRLAVARDVPVVVVDLEPTSFARLAVQSGIGAFVQGRSAEVLPAIVAELCGGAPPA